MRAPQPGHAPLPVCLRRPFSRGPSPGLVRGTPVAAVSCVSRAFCIRKVGRAAAGGKNNQKKACVRKAREVGRPGWRGVASFRARSGEGDRWRKKKSCNRRNRRRRMRSGPNRFVLTAGLKTVRCMHSWWFVVLLYAALFPAAISQDGSALGAHACQAPRLRNAVADSFAGRWSVSTFLVFMFSVCVFFVEFSRCSSFLPRRDNRA